MVGLNSAQMSGALFAAEFAIGDIDHPSVFYPAALGCELTTNGFWSLPPASIRLVQYPPYRRQCDNTKGANQYGARDATGDRGFLVAGQTNGRLGDKPCWIV
ncbi:MAG: hypothetical protein U1E91_03595 [Moraxella sp.]